MKTRCCGRNQARPRNWGQVRGGGGAPRPWGRGERGRGVGRGGVWRQRSGQSAPGPLHATVSADIALDPARADRILPVNVWYPVDPVDAPFPLVVLSHGLGGSVEYLLPLAEVWASRGYVVALPRFPLTNRATPGGPVAQDVQNQPADVMRLMEKERVTIWSAGIASSTRKLARSSTAGARVSISSPISRPAA